jgi:hypothetical protein
MRLDQNPVYRKAIYPWYDSEAACYVLLAFMLPVFLFGITGILVASDIAEYHEYIWVPSLLVFLSSVVILSISTRLVRRYLNRYSK